MIKAGESQWHKRGDVWFQKAIMTANGSLIYSYHYMQKSGKPCLVLEVNTKITRQICAYTLIEKDLRETLAFLEENKKIYFDFEEGMEREILLRSLGRAVAVLTVL